MIYYMDNYTWLLKSIEESKIYSNYISSFQLILVDSKIVYTYGPIMFLTTVSVKI